MENWTQITSTDELRGLLELPPDTGLPTLEQLAVSLPEGRHFVRRETDDMPFDSGTLGYLVPGTRFFVNLHKLREFRGDILIAVLAYGYSQSLPFAACMAIVRKAYGQLSLLTEDEVEVVRVIMGRFQGRWPYGLPVAVEDLAASYRDATVSLPDLLASLEDKGVIKTRRDGRLELIV